MAESPAQRAGHVCGQPRVSLETFFQPPSWTIILSQKHRPVLGWLFYIGTQRFHLTPECVVEPGWPPDWYAQGSIIKAYSLAGETTR